MQLKIAIQLMKKSNEGLKSNPDATMHYKTDSDFIPRIGDKISLQDVCYLNDNDLCGTVESVELVYSPIADTTAYVYAGQICVTDAEMSTLERNSGASMWSFNYTYANG